MKLYNLYNLNIRSDITLSNDIVRNTNKADLNIKESAKSPLTVNYKWYKRFYVNRKRWMSFGENDSDYGVRFHSIADFKICLKNKEILFFKRKLTDNNTIRHLLTDQIIPLALSLQNKTIFHSSSVKIGDYAVSFQATSGSGKSTLAAYFTTKGHGLISDDTLLIEEINKKIYCYPSYPGIRLWPENIKNLFINKIKTKNASQFNIKRLIDTNINSLENVKKPTLLKSIYFINNTDHTDIELITPTDAFSAIIKNIFRLNLRSKEINKNQFEFINKILSTVEIYRLNYEKKYESLEKVYKLITDQSLN